jgi:hypothetical protein
MANDEELATFLMLPSSKYFKPVGKKERPLGHVSE